MADKDAIERVRGKGLDTPILIVRVFHVADPDYTYAFVRQDGPEVLVVDDGNGQGPKEELKTFPAADLVNVAVFREALIAHGSTPLPSGGAPR